MVRYGKSGKCKLVPHHTTLYCTVLYCTVLYCTVLYCTVISRSTSGSGNIRVQNDTRCSACAIANFSGALCMDFSLATTKVHEVSKDRLGGQCAHDQIKEQRQRVVAIGWLQKDRDAISCSVMALHSHRVNSCICSAVLYCTQPVLCCTHRSTAM